MENSNAAGDLFAWIFLAAIFLTIFIVPALLMRRHHKRSKLKLAQLRQEQALETPAQAEARKQQHNSHVVSVIATVAGILIGSKLLGNIALGLVLGIVLGAIAAYLTDSRKAK